MKYLLIVLLSLGFIHTQAQPVQRSLLHDNTNRTYRLYVPDSYDAGKATPLVLAFHGLGDQASNFEGIGFNALANQDTFIAVYPQATVDQLFGASAWNAGVGALGFTINSGTDDVGFIDALLDSLEIEFAIDADRIYATGFSLGAYFSQRLACERSDKFAAIASVSGLIGSAINCQASKAMPVLHFHGTADSTITYFGEFPIPAIGKQKVGLSVDELISNWTTNNNCNTTPVIDSVPNTANDGFRVEKFEFEQCEQESEFLFYKIYGGGHTWFFEPQNDIDQTALIWDFFKRHPAEKSSDTIINSISEAAFNDLQLYPNPTQNILQVHGTEQVENIQLLDLSGRLLYELNQPQWPLSISLAHLMDGLYFLQVKYEKSKRQWKVLKQ